MNLVTDKESHLDLPVSDVLQFVLEDGSKISVRPSGTEPKIKYYFGVREKLSDKLNFDEVDKKLDNKIENIIASMHIR